MMKDKVGKMMEKNLNLMYNEVYVFLEILGDEYINKIPKSIYEFIKDNRVEGYNFQISNVNEIYKELSDEALMFIAFINLSYWCSKEEKEKLLKKYKQNDFKMNFSVQKSLDLNNLKSMENKDIKGEITAKCKEVDNRDTKAEKDNIDNKIDNEMDNAEDENAQERLIVKNQEKSIFSKIRNYFINIYNKFKK